MPPATITQLLTSSTGLMTVLRPTMTITATDGSNAVSDGSSTNDATLALTFTSSEATTDFAAEDITVTTVRSGAPFRVPGQYTPPHLLLLQREQQPLM
jgi:hypothetical protein